MKDPAERAHAALLAQRLAEEVCVLYGWTGGPPETEREKALLELWMEWYAAYEASGGDSGPKAHPELSDERIAVLARQRDAKRQRTLDQINQLIETTP